MPPAYVMGRSHHSERLRTSVSSMPDCLPSTATAWMRNSQQCSPNIAKVSGERRNCVVWVQRSQQTAYEPSSSGRQERSRTSFSRGTAAARSRRRSGENFPSTKRNEVTMTWAAPASSHFCAFAGVMPPPTCKKPRCAPRALRAASSLPGPSIMTCAPARPSE